MLCYLIKEKSVVKQGIDFGLFQYKFIETV